MSSDNIFTLANRSLKLDHPSDIQPHLSPLLSSTTTTEIHLGGNTLGAPACTHLGTILRTKPTLRVAKFDDIFTSRLLSEIPPALSSLLTSLLELPNLHTVDLSDNAFGLNTQAPLVDFLSKHLPLKHLILQNNGLGPNAGTLIANALAELAERKAEARREGKEVPDLETVICGRNRLESGSMAAWAKAYRAHKRVRTVKMVQNGIRQDGVSLLLREGLRGCEELEVLDLQDNTFTITGAKALAEVVPGWKGLRELGVGDSLLGGRGARELAAVLAKGGNKGLRVLRLQYNEIDARGVGELLRAAREGLPGLRRVELNGNKFLEEDEGAEGLRTLLEERREEAGGEKGSEEWGLDELDELEEESEEEDEAEGSEEEEEREEEVETETRRERILKEADQEEASKVSQKKDKDVDDLAETLGKTEI
ncbi:Ran GAP Rna1 [Lecanora helva]